METKTIILDTDEAAASQKTVTGWVSRNGRFYGKDEQLARWDGCTHKVCEKCGNQHEKTWTCCENCRRKNALERYQKYPFKEWDGKEPVCMFDGDKYFFSEEDIEMYLEDNEELQPEDLRLVICEPNYAHEISEDWWADDLPEDGEMPKALSDKIDELNKFIKTLPPLSYSPGKVRTEYTRSE